MIIQTGSRTDIPAFYADWFANRLRDGYGRDIEPNVPDIADENGFLKV